MSDRAGLAGDNRSRGSAETGGVSVPSHLDRLETLFAEQYRREIEHEENVWRSLPFFSATLAVEVAILGQAAPLLLSVSGGLAAFVGLVGASLALLILGVLQALLQSIRRQPFSYISGEGELLDYASRLESVIDPADPTGPQEVARLLQRRLLEQYRAANEANRRINERRGQARARAGVLLLASIVATLALVGVTLAHQVMSAPAGGSHGEGTGPRRAGAATGGVVGGGEPGRAAPPRPRSAGGGGAAQDAGGGEGLDLQGEPAQRRGGAGPRAPDRGAQP
jgi:hypothetical protein